MSTNGYLTVHTFASVARFPIEGVTIAVSKKTPSGGTELLAARITDQSGSIVPIAIETPEVSESLSPGNGASWTSVDLTADHPSYERILVENIQIFPGIQTNQNLELIPNSEFPEVHNMTEVFDIPAQSL